MKEESRYQITLYSTYPYKIKIVLKDLDKFSTFTWTGLNTITGCFHQIIFKAIYRNKDICSKSWGNLPHWNISPLALQVYFPILNIYMVAEISTTSATRNLGSERERHYFLSVYLF